MKKKSSVLNNKNGVGQLLVIFGIILFIVALIISINIGTEEDSIFSEDTRFKFAIVIFMIGVFFTLFCVGLGEILHMLQLQFEEVEQLNEIIDTLTGSLGESKPSQSPVPANTDAHKPDKSLPAVLEEEFAKRNNPFIVLSKSEKVSYVEDCSIVISKSGLYRSVEYDVVFCGFTFLNASEKTVKGLKISIGAYDAFGDELEGYDGYQYIDLAARNGLTFGTNKVIILPDKFTRAIKISQITVLYEDGSLVQYGSDAIVNDLELEKIASCLDFDSVKQYRLELSQDAVYAPLDIGKIWFCSCGRMNIGSTCDECGCSKKFVFSTFEKYSGKGSDVVESDDSVVQPEIDMGNQAPAESDEDEDIGLKMLLDSFEQEPEDNPEDNGEDNHVDNHEDNGSEKDDDES